MNPDMIVALTLITVCVAALVRHAIAGGDRHGR